MKHKHYDMIVAKAANMDLVVLNKNAVDEWIEQEYTETDVKFSETGFGYFLCLPQHKEPCLHWLNGGEVQDFFKGEWADCGGAFDWSCDHMMMDDEAKYRIKPKKEKRWIAYNPRQKRTNILTFDTRESIKDHYIGEPNADFQFIEIEVDATAK